MLSLHTPIVVNQLGMALAMVWEFVGNPTNLWAKSNLWAKPLQKFATLLVPAINPNQQSSFQVSAFEYNGKTWVYTQAVIEGIAFQH
jgi:hypothetical protein